MLNTPKTDILLVDDDDKNIFALSAVLKSRGYHCVTAKSALEGIRILKSRPEIGIILMDMMMPDMDGYQAINAIRKINRLRHIPIVAVTAQAMDGDREKCMAAGAADYLSKPVNIEDLFHTLSRHNG